LEDVDGLEGTERGYQEFSTLDVVFRCVSYFGGVTRADLLPPPKRIRDSDLVADFEVSSKDGYEPYVPRKTGLGVGVEDKLERGINGKKRRREEKQGKQKGIEKYRDEEASLVRESRIEVELTQRNKPVIDDDLRVSVREDVPDHVTTDGVVEVIESVQRDQGHRIAATSQQSATKSESVTNREKTRSLPKV
ncbi:hypothetical protein Tco_1550152, partial [Tanacetum coccineum]